MTTLICFLVAATITVDGTSIQDAVNAAQAGDTIIVMGTNEASPRLYPERLDFQGSAESIILQAVPRRSVLIYGVRTRGCDELTVDGFQMTYEGYIRYTVHIESNYVTIRDNYIYDVVGIAMGSPRADPLYVGGRILNNYLYHIGQGLSIHGSDWLIEGNEIESPKKWDNRSPDSDYSRAFGDNFIFRGNYFHGALRAEIGASHVDGFQTFGDNGDELHGLLFENNIVISFGQGMIMTSDTGPGGVSDVIVRNNVFDGGEMGGAYGILTHFGIENLSIIHNLFANNLHHGVRIRDTGEATVQNNIFYNAGSNYYAVDDATIIGGYNLLNREVYPYYKEPTDIVNVDPLFIDPDNWVGADGIPFTDDDGWQLQLESPAIDAGNDGNDMGPNIVLTDPDPDPEPIVPVLKLGDTVLTEAWLIELLELLE